jgi:hypothetical protein
VNFYFFTEEQTLKFKSPMGPDRHRIMRKFQIANVIADQRHAGKIQKMWDNFIHIYDLLNVYESEVTLEPEAVKKIIKQWAKHTFIQSHEVGSKPWKIERKELTPYVHTLMNHFCEHLKTLKRISCQNMERQNNLDGRQFFQCNSRSLKNALGEMLLFKLRKLLNPRFPEVEARRGVNKCAFCRKRFVHQLGCIKHQETCGQNPDSVEKDGTIKKEYLLFPEEKQ